MGGRLIQYISGNYSFIKKKKMLLIVLIIDLLLSTYKAVIINN